MHWRPGMVSHSDAEAPTSWNEKQKFYVFQKKQ